VATLSAGLAAPVGAAVAGGHQGPTGRLVRAASSAPLPPGSRALGPVAPDTLVHVDVVLKPRDRSALVAFDSAVSTPGSASFRHYLTPAAFGARYGPAPSTIAATRRWLAGLGVTLGESAPGGFVIPVSGTAARIGSAFGVAIDDYRLPSGRIAYAPTERALVPASLASSLDGLVGLDDLSLPAPQHVRSADRAGASPSTSANSKASASAASAAPAPRTSGPVPHVAGPTPVPAGGNASCSSPMTIASAGLSSGTKTADQLAQAYSFSSVYGAGNEGQGITVGVYELEPFLPSDVTQFENCYSPAITAPVNPLGVDGSDPTLNAGEGEAALDIETLVGLAPQVTADVYVGPNAGVGPLDTYVAMINPAGGSGFPAPPPVITTSWGQCEAQTGIAVIEAESSLFEEAVAQGQSVVAAGGDEGSEDCFIFPTSNDTSLSVDDPASQPWVTGVGGTAVNALGPPPGETVWNSGLFGGTGGGGISSVWTMPAWQRGPGVQNGFTKPRDNFTGAAPCPLSSGGGTVSCRQVPDVAADGDPSTGYAVLCSCNGGGARWQTIGGTSMGSPLWAAVAALADEPNPSSPVGFLDPALYQLGCAPSPTAFNDVTSGDNQPSGSPPSDPPYRPSGPDYPATAHYDLASGLGSPVTSVLVSRLRSPPDACPVVTSMSTSSGPAAGGTTVTFTGSNLGGVSEVDFGAGDAAPVQANSSTLITVTSPVSPTRGWADVNVTARWGSDVVGLDGTLPFRYIGPSGYWTVATDGGIFSFGQLGFYGSTGAIHLNQPVVGMAPTPSAHGYWTVASDGGIFAFGDAGFHGSMGSVRLNRPVVGMAATPDGGGYWLVASDGGIFAFGDAAFFGSTGGVHLNKPVVAMAATPDGGGYWLVASDGGVFAFGDAGFFGSMGGTRLNQPVVGMATTPDGGGYWMVATDGGIFAFGDAAFHGSMGGTRLNQPVVGMAPTPDGGGYWLVASDGGIFAFGGQDGGFFGSMGGTHLNQPMVGIGAP